MSSRCLSFAVAGLVPILASCAADSVVGPSTPREPSTIVFGSPEVANTYSNVAAVIYQRPNGTYAPFCTGTLIDPTVVLTAAHCVAYFETVLAPRGYTLYVSFRNVIAYGSEADAATTA